MNNQFSEPPKQDLGEAACRLARIWMETAKHAVDIAHARRTVFQAYVAEGFTETQALELIKNL